MFKVKNGVLIDCRMFIIDNGLLKDCEYNYPMKLGVVILPEGIEALGCCSMERFACRKLIMPSTLKSIREHALVNADIDVIDFGDCKLDDIRAFAFSGCYAKTKRIPDSVRIIESFGIRDLNIGNGKILKLPSSLREIHGLAIHFDEYSIVEVDEGSVTENSGLYKEILWSLYSDKAKPWLQVKVFREKRLVQEFVISSEFERIGKRARLIRGNKVDYQLYDEWFGKVRNKQCKLRMAFLRLKWPVDLSDDMKKKYDSYVSLDKLLQFDNGGEDISAPYRKELENKLLCCHLEEGLENAMRKKDGERIAYLLELINRRYGVIEKSLEL
jgi:hypothetical protein